MEEFDERSGSVRLRAVATSETGCVLRDDGHFATTFGSGVLGKLDRAR